MIIKEINVENIVRSVAIVAIGLPASIGIGNFFSGVEETVHETAHTITEMVSYDVEVNSIKGQVKAEVAENCLDYYFSKPDTAVDRTAKDAIDKTFGGEIDYQTVCNWAIN